MPTHPLAQLVDQFDTEAAGLTVLRLRSAAQQRHQQPVRRLRVPRQVETELNWQAERRAFAAALLLPIVGLLIWVALP